MLNFFESAENRLKIILFMAFTILCILIAVLSDYNFATGSGNLTMILFVIAQAYLPARRLRIFFMLKDDAFFGIFLRVHCWLNTLAFVWSCVHCYATHWHNTYLWIALGLMGWLTFGGMILRFRYPPAIGKGLYFLHTQTIVFVIMCLCLLKGHYVF